MESAVRQVMKTTEPSCAQCGSLRWVMSNSSFGSKKRMPRCYDDHEMAQAK
jgi:hypothetical protein